MSFLAFFMTQGCPLFVVLILVIALHAHADPANTNLTFRIETIDQPEMVFAKTSQIPCRLHTEVKGYSRAAVILFEF